MSQGCGLYIAQCYEKYMDDWDFDTKETLVEYCKKPSGSILIEI